MTVNERNACFLANKNLIHSYMWKLCPTEWKNEDLIQTIYMEVLRELPKFDEARGKLYNFIYSIVSSTISTWYTYQNKISQMICDTELLEIRMNQVEIGRAHV